ncbi:MAG: hypothetical protein K9N06_07785 [Candidatus Cloacimonetes bacterium]|nr:hypothetical protein [Candidatus Cloacimonadota bacterium]
MVDIQKKERCPFTYWELEAILNTSMVDSFFRRYKDDFHNNADCAMKLHHVINSLKLKEYSAFNRKVPKSLSEILPQMKTEFENNHIADLNRNHPLFELSTEAAQNCKAFRINKDDSLSVSFLISYFYEKYSNNTITGKNKPGEVFVTAGELDYKSYSELRTMYFDTIMHMAFKPITKFSFIAGPRISCPDGFDKKSGNLEDANYMIYLIDKFRAQHSFYHALKRVNFHSIVHEFDRSICLVEDYHKEFERRSTTIVFDSPELCDILIQRHSDAANYSQKLELKKGSKEQLMDLLKEESDFT